MVPALRVHNGETRGHKTTCNLPGTEWVFDTFVTKFDD